MTNKGQNSQIIKLQANERGTFSSDFVLEKSIFSNVFEKDIRRVFIYKKAERLAKAIHLITPAFPTSSSMRNRIDLIAIGLVDAAIRPPSLARESFSRELLALSSILSIARSGGLLSPMNADLIAHEAQNLLQEIAAYEEPRLFLDDTPTLAELAKKQPAPLPRTPTPRLQNSAQSLKGHISDTSPLSERRESILSVIKDKGTVYIKDISTIIRGVSEKTIQRELQKLVAKGIVSKKGNRRWTAYSLN